MVRVVLSTPVLVAARAAEDPIGVAYPVFCVKLGDPPVALLHRKTGETELISATTSDLFSGACPVRVWLGSVRSVVRTTVRTLSLNREEAEQLVPSEEVVARLLEGAKSTRSAPSNASAVSSILAMTRLLVDIENMPTPTPMGVGRTLRCCHNHLVDVETAVKQDMMMGRTPPRIIKCTEPGCEQLFPVPILRVGGFLSDEVERQIRNSTLPPLSCGDPPSLFDWLTTEL